MSPQPRKTENCHYSNPVGQGRMSDRDRKSRFGGPKGRTRQDRDRNQHGKPGRSQGGGRPPWRDRDAKGGIKGGGRGHSKGHGKGDGPVIPYGWHSVTMALANPKRRIRKLFVTENAERRLADEKLIPACHPNWCIREISTGALARMPSIRAC
jgi:hypothetical protein